MIYLIVIGTTLKYAFTRTTADWPVQLYYQQLTRQMAIPRSLYGLDCDRPLPSPGLRGSGNPNSRLCCGNYAGLAYRDPINAFRTLPTPAPK